MKIKITFTGPSVLEGIQSGDVVEIEPGFTVSQLYDKFGVKPEFHHMIVPFVNQAPKELSYILKEEDVLDLYLPVSGG